MNKYINVLIFAFGALAGIAVTEKYFKKKYERMTQEEIDSVKETFSRSRKSSEESISETNAASEQADVAATAKDKPEIREYAAKLHKLNYNECVNPKTPIQDEESCTYIPHVIDPDDFGDLDEYKLISLTYYADGVLADENDDPVSDIDTLIGPDTLSGFDLCEDYIFVRNDLLKTEYEILRDRRNYSYVREFMP